jgi:hypothetical protein
MKRFWLISTFALLLGVPVLGHSQLLSNVGSKSLLQLSGSPASTDGIPRDVLILVLTEAAPYYGYLPSDFIDMYYTCGCITVEQLSPDTYLVIYGGLGIQIIIDGSRLSGSGITPKNGSRGR